jgi:hypothetical protein
MCCQRTEALNPEELFSQIDANRASSRRVVVTLALAFRLHISERYPFTSSLHFLISKMCCQPREAINCDALFRKVNDKAKEIGKMEEFLSTGMRTRASWEKLDKLRIEHGTLWEDYVGLRDRLYPQWTWQQMFVSLPEMTEREPSWSGLVIPIEPEPRKRYLDSETDSE